jgi:HD domain
MSARTKTPILGEKYRKAFLFASEAHHNQVRKQTWVPNLPYMTHLQAVAGLTLEFGGGEDEACAALLHDAIEDTRVTYEQILSHFGKAVADIVQGCTNPKIDWSEHTVEEGQELCRKHRAEYRKELKTAPPSIRLVSSCDKLHNARTIIQEIRVAGGNTAVLLKFRDTPEETIRYYELLAEVYQAHYTTPTEPGDEERVGRMCRGVQAAGRELALVVLDIRRAVVLAR